MEAPDSYEWCPNCGNGVHKLNPVTGFCAKCTYSITGYKECERCGRLFKADQNSRTQCPSCRNRAWLNVHADRIEEVMIEENISARKAIKLVRQEIDDNWPRCSLCGDPMKGRSRQRNKFCGKKDACRRAAIRYYNYRKRKGMSDDEALRKAIGKTADD